MSLEYRWSATIAGVILAVATHASAEDQSPSVDSASPPIKEAGNESIVTTAAAADSELLFRAALYPLEDVLTALRESSGLSFIFDSRLLAGKAIPRIDVKSAPIADLRSNLQGVDLDLQQIAPKTFIITESASPIVQQAVVHATPVIALKAPAVDTIFVTAGAASAATLGSRQIFEIDADALAYLNATAPSDAIYDLPQSLASFTPANTALLGPIAGVSFADIRGLDTSRTLVLVNGRAPTITPGGNGNIAGVDLNSIAAPFIERIEVQTSPGAARYGARAAAGVVNIVMKSDIDGIEADIRAGISEKGDSERLSLAVLGGKDLFNGAAHISAGVNVARIEGLVGADRELTSIPYGFALNGLASMAPGAEFLPGFGGSKVTDRGAITGFFRTDGSFEILGSGKEFVPTTSGSVAPFVGTVDQLFNWSAFQNVILPVDRALGFASFNADIGAASRLFLDARFGVSGIDVRLAPTPATHLRGYDDVAGDGAIISLGDPSIPAGVRDFALSTFGADTAAIIFDHRYVELGPRRDEVDRRYTDVIVGVEHGDDDTWRLALSYRYGGNRVNFHEYNRPDGNRLQIALDRDQCAATPGCAAVDFFDPLGISPDAAAFIRAPRTERRIAIDEHEISGTANKLFGDAHAHRLHAGVDLRSTSFVEIDNSPPGVATLGSFVSNEPAGALRTIDIYGGAEAQLLAAHPLLGDVDLAADLRLTASSAYDPTPNFEGAIRWSPVRGVSVFSRHHLGHRPPDIMELYNVAVSAKGSFVDPCGLPAGTAPAIDSNCASSGPLGVNPGFVQTAPLARQTFYGNSELKPENVTTRIFGLTVSPTDLVPTLPGKMELSASWLDYRIHDFIARSGNTLFACYLSAEFSSSECAQNSLTGLPAIVRDPTTRQIISYDDVLRNGGDIRWRGLDLELLYSVEPQRGPIDRFWLSALHTYTDLVTAQMPDSDLYKLDGLQSFPKHRTLLWAGAERGNVSISIWARRRGSAQTVVSDSPESKIPAITNVDASVRYNFNERTYVQFGVENLTNAAAPLIAYTGEGNTLPQYYDVIGRRFAIGSRVAF